MDDIEQRIKRNALKSGLLLGVVLLALSISSFYFITTIAKSAIMFLAGPTVFSFVIPIILVILFCFDARKRIGGYWSFKEATTSIFIMFFTAYVIQTVGRDLIFAKFIEPDMVKKTQIAFIKASEQMKKFAGADQKRIDKNITDIKQNMDEQKNISVGNVISGIAINIIFIFVFALIFGALFKKEEPLSADPA